MSVTKTVLERQTVSKDYEFGTNAASGQGSVTVRRGTAAATATTGLIIEGSGTIGGNFYVAGNFTYGGVIDRETVTNTAVTDKNIITNVGGSTASAAGAGLQVEGDAAAIIGGITYAAASATKWQVGDGTTQVDIVDKSTAQPLTNKTYNGMTVTATTGTFTLAAGKTFTVNNTLTFTGTDASSVAFGAGGTVAYLTNKLSAFAATTSAELAGVISDETGSNKLVFSTAPVFDTNITIGVAAGATGAAIFKGITSGTVTLQVADAAGTYTFTLPVSGGTTGYPLVTTDGAGTTAFQLLGVAGGGTGIATTTAYGVICAGTTATGPWQALAALGAAGTVLTSNGAGALPSFQAISASTYFRRTTVAGDQDNSNKTYTLGNALTAGTDLFIMNGQPLSYGSGNDYTISGTTLTFDADALRTPPAPGDKLIMYGQY